MHWRQNKIEAYENLNELLLGETYLQSQLSIEEEQTDVVPQSINTMEIKEVQQYPWNGLALEKVTLYWKDTGEPFENRQHESYWGAIRLLAYRSFIGKKVIRFNNQLIFISSYKQFAFYERQFHADPATGFEVVFPQDEKECFESFFDYTCVRLTGRSEQRQMFPLKKWRQKPESCLIEACFVPRILGPYGYIKDFFEKLMREAEKEGPSVSDLIKSRLDQYFDKHPAPTLLIQHSSQGQTLQGIARLRILGWATRTAVKDEIENHLPQLCRYLYENLIEEYGERCPALKEKDPVQVQQALDAFIRDTILHQEYELDDLVFEKMRKAGIPIHVITELKEQCGRTSCRRIAKLSEWENLLDQVGIRNEADKETVQRCASIWRKHF
ncbi:MAG: hypothetical protein HQM11_08895 [SAR324 cluster bacterium]|nr:hypothetical protein [SAR324 cluster bacterium]